MSKYLDGKDLFLEPVINEQGSHMVMTNVMKPTFTKIVNIDTKYCDDFQYSATSAHSSSLSTTTTPANMHSSLNITLPEKINDVKSILVKNVELPISMYNISASLGNNVFTATNNITTTTTRITVADGQYTASSLISAIQAQLPAGISLALNPTTNVCSFTVSSGNSFSLAFAVDSAGAFDKNNARDKLGWLIGFRAATTYSIAAGITIAGDVQINLDGLKYVYLVIDEFAKGNHTSVVSYNASSITTKNIICKISLDRSLFGSVMIASEPTGNLVGTPRVYSNKIDLHRLNVRLVDGRGANVNLNGHDFSFSLEVKYK